MRDKKTTYKACLIFLVSILVASSVCYSSAGPTNEAIPLEDPNAVLQMLISAVNAVEHPITGRGVAKMKIENYLESLDGKDLTVDFVFKDRKSRVDFFESDSSGNLSRLSAAAKSDKASIGVNDFGAFLQRPEFHINEVGRDFNPESFFNVLGYPLIRWLEDEVDRRRAPKDRIFKLDNKGILHLFVRTHAIKATGKDYVIEKKFLFDTQKGFRPILYDRKFKYPDGSWNGKMVKLQWTKFDSAWYVSAFEYNELPSNHAHTVGKIETFKPNVEVSDEEFTLKGMNVPDGLLVGDSIRGISYRFGAPVDTIEDLNKALEKADFVKKIKAKKQTPLNQKDYTNINQQIIDQNQIQVDGSMEQTNINDTHADLFLLRGIVIAGIVVFIGIVSFFGYRYFVT